jgi:hypothetical protein
MDLVASFLLAVERGAFLGCNGWDEAVMGRPLGHPQGPYRRDAAGIMLYRNFSTGTLVTWDLKAKKNQGKVHWAE